MMSDAGWRVAALAATLFVALALIPGVAQAAPTLNVSMSFPPAATVGQTLSASFTLTNNSTAEDPSFRICRAGDTGVCAGQAGIIMTPSCAQDLGATCTGAGADPGVFAINEEAIGGAGTVCAGTTFVTTPLGDAFGKVRFAPTGGLPINISIGESCRVDFTFNVLKTPTLDARPQGGLQTAPIVTASAETYLNALISGGASTSLTINPGAPAAPTVTDIDPDSPASDNAPEVKGTAPGGTTVSVYTNASCTGSPVAQGSSAAFASPGLTAPVADNSTTTFYASATDPGTGLSSACSTSSRTYAEDSVAPETTIISGPSGPTDDDTPVFTFTTNDPAAGLSCRLDNAPFAPCLSPFQALTLSGGEHTFEVRATDSVGNVDPTPASRSFTVGTAFRPADVTGCALRGNNVIGTPDNDTLSGTSSVDIIVGLASSDLLRGLAGRDCLFGGGGTDRLFGGAGADLLFGGADNDTLNGEAGNDRVSGDAGLDRIDGGAGNDTLVGGAGIDRITDRRGTDGISAGAANDRIDTRDTSPIDRRGRDRIACGAGVDTVLADRRDVVQRDCERVTRR